MSRWRQWQREHGVAAGAGPEGPRRRFQPEDILLAVWVLLAQRGFALLFGSDPSRWFSAADGSTMSGRSVAETVVGLALAPSPIAIVRWWQSLPPLGWAAWSTVLGLALVVLTRGREDTSVDEGLARRMLITGPLYYVLALGVAMVAHVGGRATDAAQQPLYPGFTTPPWLRRTAVLPAALFGQGAFRLYLGEFLGFDTELGAAQIALETVLLVATFALCVAGPRIAAGATRVPLAWLPRFLLFAGAALAARWLPV